MPLSGVDVFGGKGETNTQRFHIRGKDLHAFGRCIGVVNKAAGRFPYAWEAVACLAFGIDVLQVLALLPKKHAITEETPIESLVATLALANPHTHGPRPSEEISEFQQYLAASLAGLACVRVASGPQPVTVAQFLAQDESVRYAESIRGNSSIQDTDSFFLHRLIDDLQAFEQKSNSMTAFQRCLEETEFWKLRCKCSEIVRKFNRARGQTIFALTLDDGNIESMRGPLNSSDGEVGHFVGLGAGETDVGDEVWALQGAEWHFVLRPHRQDYGQRRDSHVNDRGPSPLWHSNEEQRSREPGDPQVHQNLAPNNTDSGPQIEGDSYWEPGKPARVYRFLGEAYLHGLMHGELFEASDSSPDLEEIILRQETF